MQKLFHPFKTKLASTLLRFFIFLLLFVFVTAQVPVLNAYAAGTDLTLTKTVEGGVTTAQVGDVIRYRIHFACSNLTTPCGPMEITDVLQPGLNYLPPPASSVPGGFSISYAAGSRTITITKDDNNLLDGSQYDAVIAVQVDYDLRTLPATINNTVNGRIAPTGPGNWEVTTPSSAPPITIGSANPYWAITKTLSSPVIEPTVDTDVTYQIALCPTAPPPGEGNVALRNITIVDTLPAGATFVSASDGGVFSLGTVTWPVFAGPLYPPNCLTRYVTVRYNSADGFNPGDNVTNTVDYDADYTPSTGTCTSPCTGSGGNINHNIDPILEVPTYSKDDAGDPVGFTGTGRFILNLDTNDTNFPSRDLILVDNMPPQFQITGVTSGGWDATFDYIRATVEYSTNNGANYTSFGPPVFYNTNITYSMGLPANITNVRWRFEYDPDKTAPYDYTQAGLPYTWAFTSSPEIRVTPRSAPVSTDLPAVVTLPAAVAGNTYNNCLQVTRTDSGGSLVTDPCDIEPMSVQGTFVSLRTSKNETPGAGWDGLDDPDILTFVPDTSILPGDTVKYTITVEITERSSSPLVNPIIRDTLPEHGAGIADLIFVRNGTAQLDGTPLPALQQPTFSQAGQVLTWNFSSLPPVAPLALGSRFLTVEFYAYIPRGQSPSTYTNDLYTVTDSADVLCEIGAQPQDSGDVDGDGNTTEFACQNPDTYVVERSAALRGEKWIRSTAPENNEVVLASNFLPDASCPNGGTNGLTNIPTNPFTRYPCISQAFPEGALSPGQFDPPPPAINPALDDFEYNLRIFNDGNVPMLKYVLYDILPRVGDTGSGGVLANSARLSEFRPALSGPIQFIQGPGPLVPLVATDFTIEYNYTTNPCRPEVFDQPTGATVPVGCDDNWDDETEVTDWTQVRSYRIRLNNDGSLASPAIAQAVPAGSELRFGAPMHILADAPPAGFDTNDALSHEIAWNSFSHVGSYDKGASVIQDLLASEPRKVGITVPERMSVGNRVWRDADNSGTINAPDDTNPGIAGVIVNLYRDTDNDGIADGAAISTTTTDTEGYYLFSNIPYDPPNNRFIIGIPASNFAPTFPLESLRSSTGTPAVATYTTPTSNVIDSADDGIDPALPGQEVFSWSFTLQPTTEPTSEGDLSNNARDGLAGQRRGVNGERDNNSDLTVDFGFFGGTDVPFSIGNRVWYDNGQTAAPGVFNYAQRNDGIRQPDEPPTAGVRVNLYRDGNLNGLPESAELIRYDNTDTGGYYLFDNLDPGQYFVQIPASNFAAGQPLAGWYSSQPVMPANVDDNDNGINNNFPEINGIRSGPIVLTRGVPTPLGETDLSSDASMALGFNPTTGDGTGHLGRFGETDATSNVTIDFGFIPPMSLGNRVWIDEGAGTLPFRAGFNNALQDGTEVGVSGVTVQLWRDTNGTPGLQIAGDTLMCTTTTDVSGYYLFDRLQPANNYFVHIPAANFTAAGALVNYLSSTDVSTPADDAIDKNDNGTDNPTPATNGISGPQIAMAYNTEPLTPANETDIPANTPANVALYGTNLRGLYGQDDGDSNLTMDFGFVRPPRSIGNRLWIDTNNDGILNGAEPPVPTGVRVSLYLDANANGVPDDFNGDTVFDNNDAIAFDLTDANGYYLFDKLPPNNYIVGVDRLNFVPSGLLDGYNSSKGSVDNASNNTNELDNGVDRLLRADPVASPHGILSTRIKLTTTPVNAPNGEVGSGDTSMALGFNPTAGDGTNSQGRYGETDANSDLTIDFGFFIPMSLGNRVFLDDGTGGGTYNNGIMDGGEPPIPGVRVELYHSDGLGVPVGGLVAFDTTDAGGYYLFDDLAEGTYVVLISGSNFTGAGPLVGRGSSTPTGTEDGGVALNPHAPITDGDDNGINSGTPATTGILSGTIVLQHNLEPTGETELSGDNTNPGSMAFSPTGWDGPTPGSRGRWGEKDANSNLTIDFGFIPVYSLGNRVWFDTNNNSVRNGAEVGINAVFVQLYDATTNTQILVGADGVLGTADDLLGGNVTTAGGGYYLFSNLPAGNYKVLLPASNFGVGQPLYKTWSSGTTISNAGVISETTDLLANNGAVRGTDSHDNGTLQTGGPLSGAVISSAFALGPGTSEPTTDNDPAVNPQAGEAPNNQSNRTVDFGFYTITLGNQVWNDLDNSGLVDVAEAGIDNVTVQLWSADGSTQIMLVGPDGIPGTVDDVAAETTTSTVATIAGTYTFTGLPAGDYIVRLPAVNFNPGGTLRDYRSSTGPLPIPLPYEPAPDADTELTDSDDNGSETNGLLGLGGYIQTLPVTMTPASEEITDDATGLTTESRVDFGVNNSPQIDLTVTKTDNVAFYAAGGTLNYVIVVTNNGPADANGMTVSDARPAQITSWAWTCAVGTPAGYNCTDSVGNPATFTDTLDLPQLASVTYNVTAQVDPAATGTLSNTVTVTPPTGMTDMTPLDNTAIDTDQPASLLVTKDDGVEIVAPGATLTYTIIVTNNGVADLTGIQLVDTLPAGVTFVSASDGGTFAAGKVTWPVFGLLSGASTPRTLTVKVVDAATLGTLVGITSLTNLVDVQDDGSHTGGTPLTGEDDDIDQILISNAKDLTGTDQGGSTSPSVLIGEILDYSIKIDVPTGTINNLQALDVLDHGLAFVSCDVTTPIVSTGLTIEHNPCTDSAYLKVQAEPMTDTDPKSIDAGRRVTFNFGHISNTSGSTQSLIVNYRVIVLDIADNANGVGGLNNHVTWTWEAGTLESEAPSVDIVEPDLSIVKTANPTTAVYGTPINFTLEITHTTESTAPAYDVVVTDALPVGLGYVSGSIVITGLAPTNYTYDIPTRTLSFVWDVFPIGSTAKIAFQAVFNGPSPVVNESSVEWTSLPLDPALIVPPATYPISPYNIYSIERWYDPNAAAPNDYRFTSSVTIVAPKSRRGGHGAGAVLPSTGFAPNVVTSLPSQPDSKAYANLGNMWLEIPKLGLSMPITGVPLVNGEWDLTWLSNQAGYLEGTTYPGQVGSSGITGHVTLADGTPGPFRNLEKLAWGDQIILRIDGQRYIYEMREVRKVIPSDFSIFKYDGYTWLTLLTCKDYAPLAQTYSYRTAVRAVLMRIEPEASSTATPGRNR